jgi:hypothetical protein
MHEVEGIRSFAEVLRHEECAGGGTVVASRQAAGGTGPKPPTGRRVTVIRKRPF